MRHRARLLALLLGASGCAQLAAGTAGVARDADVGDAVTATPRCAPCACGRLEVCVEGRCRRATPSVRWVRRFNAVRGAAQGLAVNDEGLVAASGYVQQRADLGAGPFTASRAGDGLLALYAADGALRWARSFAGDAAELRSVAFDGRGVWAGGAFGAFVEVAGQTLRAAQHPDGWVIRTDLLGAPRAALTLSGGGDEQVASVSVLGEDGLVAGYYSGAGRLGATSLRVATGHAGLVARVRADGSVAWRTSFGSANTTLRGAVAMPDGGAAVVGLFSGALEVGTTLRSQGGFDVFVARLDAAGEVRWATSYGGAGDDLPDGLARDDRGALYVVSASSEGLTVGRVTRAASAGLLVALDPDGGVRWSLGLGAIAPMGPSAVGPRRVAVDAAGNVIVAGTFREAITLEGADTLVAEGGSDFFWAIYDRAGTLLAARSFGGPGGGSLAALAAGPCGGFALGGAFFDRLDLGGVSFTASPADAFVSSWSE